MTPIQFATLLIRFYCIFALVNSTAALSEIAYGIFVVVTSSQSQYEPQHEFLLAMYIVRFFLYFGTGIGFLIFTKPLARLLAKGLDGIKHDAAA
jgi:beta-lactamase regulating signal transducer with metallopeptidase domain